MNYSVSESSDSMPVNGGVTFFEIVWKPIGSLTNDLEISDHSIDGFRVFLEIVKCESMGIGKDFVSAFKDIVDKK
jgi:hypothetical protein